MNLELYLWLQLYSLNGPETHCYKQLTDNVCHLQNGYRLQDHQYLFQVSLSVLVLIIKYFRNFRFYF